MDRIDWHKVVRLSPAALLLLLVLLSFIYGLNPFATVRHSGWYALGNVDSIPVWVIPVSPPWVDLQGNPVDASPPGDANRVESWGVSSAEMVRAMQEHELLTDWWRSEIRLAVDEGLPRDNPIVASYASTVGEIGQEFMELVPNDVLASQLTDHNRMPGVLQAGGCQPSGKISLDLVMQHYNTGTRQLCDNLIGGTQWLLALSIIALVTATIRSRLAA